ncbi:MAG TPA: c-type cytochrome [Burkholderiaceae bacterium]|nr:c-type cytochrome [Burkholderiaceae bacterium]
MKLLKLLACVPLALAGASVQAEPDPAQIQEILTKNACLACHAVDKKMIGPAYQDIADKHADDDDAAAVLAKHIREGSSGVWGQVPMPPNPGVSDDELELVVEWILAGAPE